MTDVPLLYRWRDAFVSSDLPALTKLVLFVIAHHMRPDGTGSWPSQRLIANEASMSVQSANKFIRLAEGRGYLERSDGRVRGQSWRHHSYFPAIPNHGKVFNEVEHVDQHSETEGVQPDGTPQAFNLVEGVQPHSEGVQQGGTKVFNHVELNSAYFSPSWTPISDDRGRCFRGTWTAFQTDRGRRFSLIVDDQ